MMKTLSFALIVLLLAPSAAFSQTTSPAPKKQTSSDRMKKHSVPGSPIDTLLHSHLTADVPDAQGFVKDTRPDAKTLDYTPLTGVDPVRPAPRDPANVLALQAEMEQSLRKNTARGHAARRVSKPAADE